MAEYKNLPKCEATKRGMIPPEDEKEFEKWRKSLDPDMMGFDEPQEVHFSAPKSDD